MNSFILFALFFVSVASANPHGYGHHPQHHVHVVHKPIIVEKKVPVYIPKYITKKVIVPITKTKTVVEKVPVYVPKYIEKVKYVEKPVYKYIEKQPEYKHQSYGGDSYGHSALSTYGGDSYGHSAPSYGGDSYGDSYGHSAPSYGGDSYGGDSYGHSAPSYGGDSYGDSYGQSAPSYGGDSYGYKKA